MLKDILKGYIPTELDGKIEIDESLIFVVGNMLLYVAAQDMFSLFSSEGTDTNSVIRFPYSRVDAAIINCRDWIDFISECAEQKDPVSPTEFQEIYAKASRSAFRAILWVEVGFDGLDTLAESDASKNWTTEVGHSVSKEVRAERIKTNGKKLYEKILRQFVAFRNVHQIKDDIFSQHEAEVLLEKWRS